MKDPQMGDIIYVPSSIHISRGSDDTVGGKATIDMINIDKSLPKGNVNRIFVGVKEIPGVSYNYSMLLEEQEKLKKQFGDKSAYPDPDEDQPWIQDGDIVDGKVWTGGDRW